MTGEVGTIYLFHIEPPYKHARHYMGWTQAPEKRFAAHKAGQGSRLLRAAVAAGHELVLVSTCPGTRDDERKLKNLKNAPRKCPICKERKERQ